MHTQLNLKKTLTTKGTKDSKVESVMVAPLFTLSALRIPGGKEEVQL